MFDKPTGSKFFDNAPVGSLTMPLSSLMMPAYSDADLLFFLQEIVYNNR